MGILGCAYLTRHLNTGQSSRATRATQNRHPHSLRDVFVVLTLNMRCVFFSELGVNDRISDMFHDMRREEISTVGNRGTEIGNL